MHTTDTRKSKYIQFIFRFSQDNDNHWPPSVQWFVFESAQESLSFELCIAAAVDKTTRQMAVQVPIGFEELGQESEQSKQFRGVSYSEANNELDQVGRDYVSP